MLSFYVQGYTSVYAIPSLKHLLAQIVKKSIFSFSFNRTEVEKIDPLKIIELKDKIY